MIILYACLLLALMHALLPGSDLRRLGHLRLRHTWLVWLALADRIVVISVLPNLGALSEGAHLASYGLAAVLAVLNNRSAGTWIVGIGGICNLVAIVANGGTMPATSGALKASGWPAAPGHFANSAALPNPRLVALGDVFSTPPSWTGLPWPPCDPGMPTTPRDEPGSRPQREPRHLRPDAKSRDCPRVADGVVSNERSVPDPDGLASHHAQSRRSRIDEVSVPAAGRSGVAPRGIDRTWQPACRRGWPAARRRCSSPKTRYLLKRRLVTLTIFQQEHLRIAFDEHAPRLFGPMVEASRAHVVMLAERGLVPQTRAVRLLRGLNQLADKPPDPFVYDGSVEDVYYTVEKRLATASGVATSELDVQLARSRNDLDAGVFRIVLRGDLLRVIDEVLRTAMAALDAADRYADIVVTGYTHRRPAQPTTMGHVLAGYAEALAGEAAHYADVLEQVNRSPLGSCAFAGTDLDIDPPRLAELLGFDGIVVNSYEAVAGADHLIRVAAVNAQSLATGARLARTLMDWLTWRWIVTPPEFTQGSSIMPQKRNPVVLEHMVSMAGAAAGDAATVLNNIGAAWWEDSNNATTDVQTRLWDSCDRAQRFFALLAGLLEALEPLDPPSSAEIVRSGATTTSAADALSRHGVPFRAAHTVVGRLVRDRAPTDWTPQDVRSAAEAVGVGGQLDDAAVEEILGAAADPNRVADRAQVDGPGTVAVRRQVQILRRKFEDVSQRSSGVRERVRRAHTRLDEAVAARVDS